MTKIATVGSLCLLVVFCVSNKGQAQKPMSGLQHSASRGLRHRLFNHDRPCDGSRTKAKWRALAKEVLHLAQLSKKHNREIVLTHKHIFTAFDNKRTRQLVNKKGQLSGKMSTGNWINGGSELRVGEGQIQRVKLIEATSGRQNGFGNAVVEEAAQTAQARKTTFSARSSAGLRFFQLYRIARQLRHFSKLTVEQVKDAQRAIETGADWQPVEGENGPVYTAAF